MTRQEISRRTPLGSQAERAMKQGQPVSDETTLAIARRWFWTRKPDAGFVLADFPATLLQAKVFDEWLDARGISLDGVVITSADSAPLPVLDHYRTHGLEILPTAALLN